MSDLASVLAGRGMRQDYSEHFPSLEDRIQSSRFRRSGGGRAASPTHSAHGSLLRASIVKLQEVKKARKVNFYRNGDKFFKGMSYAVSSERHRSLDSLMAELTLSPLGDKNIMPNGVRNIFTLDGTRKVTCIDEFIEGDSYVCASTNFYKKIDYPRSTTPSWMPNVKPLYPAAAHGNNHHVEDVRGYIRPKLITVIRNGARPRKAVRILLNKKTAHSFEQVLTDITDAIKLETGACRKIFTLDGKQISSLQDFFGEESVFIAYGPEKYALDDFDLDGNEVKFVSAYTSVRQNERITLKSPKTPRRMTSSPAQGRREGMDLAIPKRRGSASSRTTSSGSLCSPRTPTKPITSPKTRSPAPPRPAPASPGAPRGHASPRSVPKSPGTRRKVQQNGQTGQNGQNSQNGQNGQNGHAHSSPSINKDKAPVLLQRDPVELTERYKIGHVIGEGNFAVVKQCVHRASGKEYALKVINKQRCQGKESMIESEVSLLRQVKHENIITLIEDLETPTELYLVMELIKGGDLFEAITTATKYTERDASGMLHNLMSALKYLHSHNIVHRDIKPENLMVCEYQDGTKELKLGDFGLATVVHEPLFVVCGTPTYVAPEVLAESGYCLKVDIWAAGVIAFILLCGFPPFASATSNNDELFDKIMSGKFSFSSPFWDDISSSAKELILCMLEVNVDERFTAEDVLDHPWVAEDLAKDDDLKTVTDKLGENFSSRRYKHRGEETPAVALIASTAADKASRFFQGRRQQIPLQGYDSGHNEVF